MSADPAAAPDPASRAAPLGRSYGREEVTILADQAALSLTSFVTEILLVRTMASDPAEYASYVLASNLLIAFLILQNSLLSIPLAVFLPGVYRDRAAPYARQLARLQRGFCAGLVAITLGAAAVFASRGEPVFARTLAALALAEVFVLGRELVRRFHFASRRAGPAFRADALAAAVQIALVSALFFAGRATGIATYAAIAIACALGILVTRLPKPGAGEEALPFGEILSRHWRLGRWVLATNLVLAGGLFAYPWLLKFLHPGPDGTAQAAHFGLIRLLIAVASPLILAVNTWTATRASHARALSGIAAMHREILRSALSLGALLAAAAGAMAIFAEPLLRVLGASPDLARTLAPSARLMALVVLLQGVSMPAQMGMNTLERPAGALPGAFGALIATGLLGVLWILRDGLAGAVRGLLVAHAALFLGYWIAYAIALRRARSEGP